MIHQTRSPRALMLPAVALAFVASLFAIVPAVAAFIPPSPPSLPWYRSETLEITSWLRFPWGLVIASGVALGIVVSPPIWRRSQFVLWIVGAAAGAVSPYAQQALTYLAPSVDVNLPVFIAMILMIAFIIGISLAVTYVLISLALQARLLQPVPPPTHCSMCGYAVGAEGRPCSECGAHPPRASAE